MNTERLHQRVAEHAFADALAAFEDQSYTRGRRRVLQRPRRPSQDVIGVCGIAVC